MPYPNDLQGLARNISTLQYHHNRLLNAINEKLLAAQENDASASSIEHLKKEYERERALTEHFTDFKTRLNTLAEKPGELSYETAETIHGLLGEIRGTFERDPHSLDGSVDTLTVNADIVEQSTQSDFAHGSRGKNAERNQSARTVIGEVMESTSMAALYRTYIKIFESNALDNLEKELEPVLNPKIEPLLSDEPMPQPGEYEPEPLPKWRQYDPGQEAPSRKEAPAKAAPEPAGETGEIEEDPFRDLEVEAEEKDRGDKLNTSFTAHKESPEEKWWGELQELLDKNNCELDLSVPADRARLTILSEPEQPEENEWSCTTSFACDPAHREVELEEITDEEILKRQGLGIPDDDVIADMMEAAKHGRLFVRGLRNGKAERVTRQIRLNDRTGETTLSEDVPHLNLSPTDDRFFNLPYEFPNPEALRPSLWDRVKAFFGNQAAKDKIERFNRDFGKKEDYDSAMELYQERRALVNELDSMEKDDPNYPEQLRNLFIAETAYFANAMTYGSGNLKIAGQLRELHDAHLLSQMSQAEKDAWHERKEKGGKVLEQFTDYRKKAREAEKSGLITKDMTDSLARVILYMRLRDKANTALEQRQAESFRPVDDEQFEKLTADYKASDEFRGLVSHLTLEDTRDLTNADDPAKLPKRIGELFRKASSRAEREEALRRPDVPVNEKSAKTTDDLKLKQPKLP